MALTGQFCINGEPLNVSPINGEGDSGPPPVTTMAVEVVDCRNLIVQFLTEEYDHFRVLNPNNWGLSLGGFINSVEHIQSDFYAVNTSRTFAGIVYTITADV